MTLSEESTKNVYSGRMMCSSFPFLLLYSYLLFISFKGPNEQEDYRGREWKSRVS